MFQKSMEEQTSAAGVAARVKRWLKIDAVRGGMLDVKFNDLSDLMVVDAALKYGSPG